MMKRIVFLCVLCMWISGCAHVPIKQPVKEVSYSPYVFEVFAENVSFDPKEGVIKYTLSENALVRIRIGVAQGGALLRTLMDWEPRKAGTHVEFWDRRDATGEVDLSGYSNLMMNIACLPADVRETQVYPESIRGVRHAPEFEIDFPKTSGRTKDGTLKVSSRVPVRIRIAERDKEWLTQSRYEVGFYVDEAFVTEDEEGVSPFTYYLNTEGFRPGRYSLTVNITAYTGEAASKSVYFYVE